MAQALTPSDRTFFRLVERAVAVNPFGAERTTLDQQLAGARGAGADLVEKLLARVTTRLASLGNARPAHFGPEDARLLEAAILFDAFHRASQAMDAYIERESKRVPGEPPARAAFAGELLGDLVRRGFSAQRAVRMLTMFFQVRRAYFFIVRGLIGRSTAMVRLRESLWSHVFGHDLALYEAHLWNRLEDFSTLLLGETGTGKGAAAAAIGRSGFLPYDEARGTFVPSFRDTFVAVNLSQYPEGILESELFGHRKGAFTGAIDSHRGVFARSSAHGAIFLDEIGEVSVPTQVKLLKVLEERTFSPLGSGETERFEGRIIAATHRAIDAPDARASLGVRDDFYYRVCSAVIVMPTLRERFEQEPAELLELVAHLLGRVTTHPTPELVQHIASVIRVERPADYEWPGNVRELEQSVRSVLLTGHCQPAPRTANVGAAVRDEDLVTRALDAWHGRNASAEAVLDAYCARLYAATGSYEGAAEIAKLDRRTVRRHVARASAALTSPSGTKRGARERARGARVP